MRESSPHLPAWRTAVKHAGYAALKFAGVLPLQRPMHPAGVPVKVDIMFWIERWDGCETADPYCLDVTHSGDIDKLTRAVLDGLTAAGVWADDRQVATLVAEREWAMPGVAPGALITITRKDTE